MLSLNVQPVEKSVSHSDGSLDVVDVFETIQGEGPYAGQPAVFVRLAGCDLQCPFCDTDYTSNRKLLSRGELLKQVQSFRPTLVVLTGGEPLRQDIGPFCLDLLNADYRVQIETNGTLYVPFHPMISVVCSPKTPRIDARLKTLISAYKYVVRAGEVYEPDGLPARTLGNCCGVARPISLAPVYIQPLDEDNADANAANIRTAIEVCLRHNYRFSPQLHKFCGLP